MPEPQSSSTSPSRALRILLVDDHPLFLEGLRNLLLSEGFQVVGMAHDGLDALVQARHLHPDLILMDVQMPRCDGLAATRLIKVEMPDCKIVMLTMSDDDQYLFEAIKSGASGYLLKCLDANQFFTYLEELQTGHPPFSPGLAEKILKEFMHQSSQTAEHEPLNKPDSPADGFQPAGSRANTAQHSPLTPRQIQILTLVGQGLTYRQVADNLGLAERTVKYHMGEILEHLHLQNRAQVIAYATRMGLTRS